MASVEAIHEILPHIERGKIEEYLKTHAGVSLESAMTHFLTADEGDATEEMPALVPADDGAADLQKALEMSLQEQSARETFEAELSGIGGAKDAPNPHDRHREEGFPAGIKNLGNSCYMNSLFQAYFTLVQLREDLFSIQVNTDDESTLMIAEMQKLFAGLQGTERSYVTPTSLVKLTGHTGLQEDPTEFNMMLLERLHQGMTGSADDDSAARKRARLEPDLITKYFGGVQTLKLKAQELDGSPVPSEDVAEEIRQVILPIEGNHNLHQCIEDFTSVTEVEGYTTPRKASVTAQRITFFTKLPAVLTFQLNRISWVENQAVKNNTPISFPTDIFMDRYLEGSLEATLERRTYVNGLRARLQELQRQLSSMQHYRASQSLPENLRGTIEYLEKLSGQTGEVQQAIRTVRRCLGDVEGQMHQLEEHIAGVQGQIDAAYDGFPQNVPYRLHAVLVHSGQSGMGHYWAYIKDHSMGVWWKMNDIGVSVVDEQSVFEQSFGAIGSQTSAYALIYVDVNRIDLSRPWNDVQNVPAWCAKLVEEDNAAFRQEIVQWDSMNSVEHKVSLFRETYERNLAGAISMLSERGEGIEPSIRSLPLYLGRIQRRDLMMHQLACDAYREIWKREPATDDPALVQQAEAALQDSDATLKLEGRQAEVYQQCVEAFDAHCRCASYLVDGVNGLLSRNDYVNSFRCFVAAKLVARRLPQDAPDLFKMCEQAFLRCAEDASTQAIRANPVQQDIGAEILNALYLFYPENMTTSRIASAWRTKGWVKQHIFEPQITVQAAPYEPEKLFEAFRASLLYYRAALD